MIHNFKQQLYGQWLKFTSIFFHRKLHMHVKTSWVQLKPDPLLITKAPTVCSTIRSRHWQLTTAARNGGSNGRKADRSPVFPALISDGNHCMGCLSKSCGLWGVNIPNSASGLLTAECCAVFSQIMRRSAAAKSCLERNVDGNPRFWKEKTKRPNCDLSFLKKLSTNKLQFRSAKANEKSSHDSSNHDLGRKKKSVTMATDISAYLVVCIDSRCPFLKVLVPLDIAILVIMSAEKQKS